MGFVFAIGFNKIIPCWLECERPFFWREMPFDIAQKGDSARVILQLLGYSSTAGIP